MKILLCHSGHQSRKVAEALKEFLKTILQRSEPFYSEEDIPKGAAWLSSLTDRLKETQTGILCLTPENLESTWIHFEAGALFKGVEKSRIHGYLFHLKKTDVKDPLGSFQNTLANKEDTFALVKSLNNHFGEAERLDLATIENLFGKFWPDLEGALNTIPKDSVTQSSVQRPDRELIEEILERVRKLNNRELPGPGVFRDFFNMHKGESWPPPILKKRLAQKIA